MMESAERETIRLGAEMGSLAAQNSYQREVDSSLLARQAAADSTAAELQRTQQELQGLVYGAAENSRQAEQYAPAFIGRVRGRVMGAQPHLRGGCGLTRSPCPHNIDRVRLCCGSHD